MDRMFAYCGSLTILKLGANFNMSQNPTTDGMFEGCYLKITSSAGLNFNGAPDYTQTKINALLTA
jgi:hypothetical protein